MASPPIRRARKAFRRRKLKRKWLRVGTSSFVKVRVMPNREEHLKVWASLWKRVDSFSNALSRHDARTVNASGLRQQARDLVQGYFHEVKGTLQRLGVTDATVKELDSEMRRLIGLSSGRNSKTSYQDVVRNIKSERKRIETGLEFLIGAESPASATLSGSEAAILATLEKMIPNAGASYKQAMLDVQQPGRVSYRGTAAELREVVREVLDHLAPDADVRSSVGFKLEEGLKGPSMKQKVRFILKARNVPDAAKQTAEDSVKHVDENLPSLSRAVYNRGSMDVHTGRTREEVLNFKLYADAILGELLEIHKVVTPGPKKEA
jgi:Predicted pPIWI-associating nuclease